MKHQYQVGQKVTLPADEVLGVQEQEVTVVSLESYGYEVEDEFEWVGPVGFNLEIFQQCC